MPRGLTLDSPWHEFLTEINDRLTAPVQLVCIGGFVVTKIYGFSRATGDLDQILTKPRKLSGELEQLAGYGSDLHRKYRLYLDNVAIVTMPMNYEERLTEAPYQYPKINLLIPDIYDLVLSKLERNSPKDQADVEYLAKQNKLSFNLLRKRFDEELDFIANRDRHVTTLDALWREWFSE
jgi:hypothetical protein